MYSLWLIPDQDATQKLNRLISDLSHKHQTPNFEAHVTLLSGICDTEAVAIQKTQELAQQLKPFSAALTHIEYLELYYRCLFFRTDDSEALMQARLEAEELFNHTNVRPFIPHVSFLYGALPKFQKDNIIRQISDDFFFGFGMSALKLVKTENRPENWQLITEIDLGLY